MSGLIDIAQNLCDSINSKVQSRSRGVSVFYKPLEYKDSIIKLYGTYEGPKDFLRIPTGDNLDYILSSENCVFLGAYLDGKLAGISAIKEVPQDYPFFRAPISEGDNNKVFTFGGLYVRPECQGFGSAKGMVQILTDSVRKYIGAQKILNPEAQIHAGMFFEADYRNCGSLSVLSKQGNYVGYYVDDKRLEGPTIMLYESFEKQPIIIERFPRLYVPDDKEKGIIELGRFTEEIAQQVGGSTSYEIPFDGQENHMVVLNNVPATTGVNKGLFRFKDKYTQDFTYYQPGEALEVLNSQSDEGKPQDEVVEDQVDDKIVPLENVPTTQTSVAGGTSRIASVTFPSCFAETIGTSAIKLDDKILEA